MKISTIFVLFVQKLYVVSLQPRDQCVHEHRILNSNFASTKFEKQAQQRPKFSKLSTKFICENGQKSILSTADPRKFWSQNFQKSASQTPSIASRLRRRVPSWRICPKFRNFTKIFNLSAGVRGGFAAVIFQQSLTTRDFDPRKIKKFPRKIIFPIFFICVYEHPHPAQMNTFCSSAAVDEKLFSWKFHDFLKFSKSVHSFSKPT